MTRRHINDQLSFSSIAYGFMNAAQWAYHDKQLQGHVSTLLDLGITTFDHADIYGAYSCEALFGKVLKQEPVLRTRMELVSKCGIQLVSEHRPSTFVKHYDSTPAHIISSTEHSLQALCTDYLDVLLFHRPDPLCDYQGMAEAFTRLKDAGKVRYFGVSNFAPEQLRAFQACFPEKLIVNQVQISLYHTEAFTDGSLDQMQALQLCPMAWSPLAGGRVAQGNDARSERIRKVLAKWHERGTTAALDEVMLAWLLTHSIKIVPVIGTGKLERVRQAIASLELKLSRQEWFELYEASAGRPVP